MAKRLIDYGFHAPTMSFPVAGTLMIEPTESEDLAELDRFCDAMIAIRARSTGWLQVVRPGRQPVEERPAHGDEAHRGRVEARLHTVGSGLPVPAATGKYWSPVRRIDQAYGDRNLVCACPPPEAFAG